MNDLCDQITNWKCLQWKGFFFFEWPRLKYIVINYSKPFRFWLIQTFLIHRFPFHPTPTSLSSLFIGHNQNRPSTLDPRLNNLLFNICLTAFEPPHLTIITDIYESKTLDKYNVMKMLLIAKYKMS